MKKSLFALFIVSALLVAGSIAPALGRTKKKAGPGPALATTITAVSENSITVTQDKALKTFTITKFTDILINGQKGTVADLRAGMTVNVAMGTDPSRASRIEASGASSSKR